MVSILGDYQRICPESARMVQHVLSGKCWHYTQEMRKTGELPVWTDNEFYDE